MTYVEPSCQPYSAKPQREWKRSADPKKWREAESDPNEWVEARPRSARLTEFRIPEIEQAITQSRRLIGLGDNWDDDGAKGISEPTWLKATEFLRRTVAAIHREKGVVLAAPALSPCADGSIDLLWRTPRYRLLVNIQPDGQSESDFYGETPDGLRIKGTFRPDTHDFGFLYWLAER